MIKSQWVCLFGAIYTLFCIAPVMFQTNDWQRMAVSFYLGVGITIVYLWGAFG